MGFLSICVRLCLLHFLIISHKGLGNATEPLSSSSSPSSSASFSSSSPSSSHSFVIQDTTNTKGCSSCVLVPQEVLQNLLEMTDAIIKDLQSQKQEESADHIEDEDLPLPSMEEGLPQESESYNQRLLLALWESETKNLQLKKEINKLREETNKYKEELEREMKEKDQVMRDCHPNPHDRHTRHRHHRHHHPQPTPILGVHPLSMAIDSTAILRSDLQDIKEVLRDMRDNGRSDRQDIKELIIDGIKAIRYNDLEKNKQEQETQKQEWPHRMDCYDHFENGGKRKSGVYTIYPFKGAAEAHGVRVWCDMGEEDVGEGKGGGWTVILQRRYLPHPVLFNRTWREYKNGFGSPDTEYWIGNKILHQLTTIGKPQALHIDMEDFDGFYKFASYGRFSVGSEEENFRLSVSMFSRKSTVKADSLEYHNSMEFSTFDRDNDKSSENCVTYLGGGGGFWNKDCDRASPTAPIRGKGNNDEEMHFGGFYNDLTTLKELSMKIRPSD